MEKTINSIRNRQLVKWLEETEHLIYYRYLGCRLPDIDAVVADASGDAFKDKSDEDLYLELYFFTTLCKNLQDEIFRRSNQREIDSAGA